jgi:hypothetical protein
MAIGNNRLIRQSSRKRLALLQAVQNEFDAAGDAQLFENPE